MKSRFINFLLLLLPCMIAVGSHAQESELPSFSIGDPAPPLRVKWLKGPPVTQFEKGKVYVVEFWATWCKPCVAAMPHLSALANKYKDKLIIIGVDVFKSKTPTKVKAFVDSVGQRMDYRVAIEDSNFMVTDWLDSTGEASEGIPRSFVINAEGRVAWVGHPKLGLAEALPKILKNKQDIKVASSNWKEEKRIAALDEEAMYTLMPYEGDSRKGDYLGKPDSLLLLINEMVKKEPGLKYASSVSAITFTALLKTDMHKACKFGKAMLAIDYPDYHLILMIINYYQDVLNLSPEIYELGIEAYQANMAGSPISADLAPNYHQMADWYWRSNHNAKAIATEKKAIEALRSKKNFSQPNMDAFELRLQQYIKIDIAGLP